MRLNVYKTMIRSATLFHNTTTTTCLSYFNSGRPDCCFTRPNLYSPPQVRFGKSVSRRIYVTNASSETVVADLPEICTADELHYVSVRKSDWRLALWRYKPSPQVCVCVREREKERDLRLS